MQDSVSRRYFMRRATAYSLGFAGLSSGLASRGLAQALLDGSTPGFGPLVPDPEGVFDLPKGFRYQIISRHGDVMSDGLRTPGLPDGMAVFPLDEERCVVVRNHELAVDPGRPTAFDDADAARIAGLADRIYDSGHGTPVPGGTTNLVYNTRTQTIERSFLSLAGTERNCAGGPTPWGTWLTCEETVAKAGEGRERDHGWIFEVPARSEPGLADPEPLVEMGRFNHEAVAVSPAGNVYMTEDRGDGLIYRYVPKTPERMREGGRLQFLCVRDRPSLNTSNREEPTVAIGEVFECEWKDVEDRLSPDDTMRHEGFERGGARFARGEGMWAGSDGIYFCCTSGGRTHDGQVFRLRFPDGADGSGEERVQLELFIQPDDSRVLQAADNVTVAPNGHLVVCEDGSKREDCLIGVSPAGRCYRLGRNASSKSELAGAAFSPDGSTMFVNIQHDGLTLAVTGPWMR